MEKWVDIIGYEGLYRISNYGNVFTIRNNRLMKPVDAGKNNKGYFQIGLSKEGVRKMKCIHRLIAEHFIPNPEDKPEVNHIDGNKKNNDISNLEWVTRSENGLHAFSTGLNEQKYIGVKHHKNKLTEKDVLKIRELYATNRYTQTELSKMFGSNQTNIGFIVRREIWKHI